jgi:hypothetical protein
MDKVLTLYAHGIGIRLSIRNSVEKSICEYSNATYSLLDIEIGTELVERILANP